MVLPPGAGEKNGVGVRDEAFFFSGLSFQSIRFKLTAFVLVILLPLIGFLLYNNLYAIRVIHGQVAESNRNLLTLYLKGIDTNLEAISNRLNAMVTLDTNLRVVATTKDESNRGTGKSGRGRPITG